VPSVHVNCDRKAWPQFAEFSVNTFKFDAHRHPLNDLGKIAGRILRRDHTELRTRRRRNTYDAAPKADAGHHVGNNLDGLAPADARQLTFLEVGINPQAVYRDDGQELSSDRRIGAGSCAAVSDHAIDRRANFRVGEIEQRQITLSKSLIKGGLRLLFLRIDDIELALRSLERCPCPALRRTRFLMVRIGLLETLTRSDPVIAPPR
jgi:hypothetical protein